MLLRLAGSMVKLWSDTSDMLNHSLDESAHLLSNVNLAALHDSPFSVTFLFFPFPSPVASARTPMCNSSVVSLVSLQGIATIL